jgi:cell filamentation protein
MSIADPHYDIWSGVLCNVPRLRSQESLDRFETAEVAASLIGLYYEPVEGNFDGFHLQEIHRRIFACVYPWAGEFRTVNFWRNEGQVFSPVCCLAENLDRMCTDLTGENCLRGLLRTRFVERAAYYLGELNTLHPFREGNGRTQREFLRELALQAGYRLCWERVEREEMYAASIQSHEMRDNRGFVEILSRVTDVVE